MQQPAIEDALKKAQEESRLMVESGIKSHLESVPVNPSILAKVCQILKERGFPQYQ